MLDGRVSIVTGSSRGIGASIARMFARNGSHVILNGHSENRDLEEMAKSLSQENGVRCLAVSGDVGDPVQSKVIFQTAFKEFKRLDILVNNAGILGDGLLGMVSDEMIDRVFQVNLAATVRNMQSAVRLMQRAGAGSIINISSIIGVRGNVGQTVYAASKAGIIGATLSAAKELGPKNIRVNVVAPGYIDTSMIRHLDKETHCQRLESISLGRVGTPEDIANAAMFLASDLSSYVTGQVIGVDGGMVI